MLSAAGRPAFFQSFRNKNIFFLLLFNVFLLVLPEAMAQGQSLLPESYETSASMLPAEEAVESKASGKPYTEMFSEKSAFLFEGPLAKTGEIKKTFFSSVSEPRILYLSPDGLDSSAGSDKAPWKTFAHALSFLQPGDTLRIKEGVYSEPIALRTSGTSTSPIKIIGMGHVVLDGKALGGETPVLSSNGESFYQLENLSIRNAPVGISIHAGSQYISMSGLKIEDCGISVRVHDSSNVSVARTTSAGALLAFSGEGRSRNLKFEKIEASGFFAGLGEKDSVLTRGFYFDSGVANVTLLDITASAYSGAGFDLRAANIIGDRITAFGNGVNLETRSKQATIRNSLFYGAGKGEGFKPELRGVGISAEGKILNLVNVTIVDNKNVDLSIKEGSLVRLENSIAARRIPGKLLQNQGGVLSEAHVIWYSENKDDMLKGRTRLWEDPGFIDWENENYRLSAQSRAVEWSSENSRAGEFDLDGAPRLYGEAIDAGAFEFQPSESGR